MNKLVFITDSGFWSHKPEIIKELNCHFLLKLFVIYIPGFVNHSDTDIKIFCEENSINLTLIYKGDLRARDPRRIFVDYKNFIIPIKEFKPEVIYIESFGSPYFVVLSRWFLGSKKVILALHDYKLHQRNKKKVKSSELIYNYLSLKLFKNFHLFSFSQAHQFKKELPNKNVYVIRLYLVDQHLKNKRNSQRNSLINFLYFGRINYYKGVDILIEAVNILQEKCCDFKVTIAGYSDDFSFYSNLIKDKNRYNLKIYNIPQSELEDLFGSADYFIAPYRTVTQSGPLMRAFHFNLIPIVSDEPGFAEYIENDRTGFLFESGSPASLADKMEKALQLNEENINEILGNLNAFKEREFNINNVVANYVRMFTCILKNE